MRRVFDRGLSCSGYPAGAPVTIAMAMTLCLAISQPSAAQTSPVDLMDASLTELLAMVTPPRDDEVDSRSWQFGYRYVRGDFGGYRDGSGPVNNVDLLGPPNNTTYPILQTNIVQEVHLFQVAYNVSGRVSANVVVPYIRQQTDHISLVPGFADFTIASKGVGDLSATLSGVLYQRGGDSLMVNAGISVPTGSITEKGHTPAGPGSQLPYTMQLGSGTWDIPVGVHYRRETNRGPGVGPVRYRFGAMGKVRSGENSRGYRLGHRLVLDGSMSMQPLRWLSPSLGLSSETWGDIKGHDLNFPGPIYPTPVANPDLFGGQRASVTFGLTFGTRQGDLGGHSLQMDFSVPVYQDLHGPQPEENWRGNLSWNLGF